MSIKGLNETDKRSCALDTGGNGHCEYGLGNSAPYDDTLQVVVALEDIESLAEVSVNGITGIGALYALEEVAGGKCAESSGESNGIVRGATLSIDCGDLLDGGSGNAEIVSGLEVAPLGDLDFGCGRAGIFGDLGNLDYVVKTVRVLGKRSSGVHTVAAEVFNRNGPTARYRLELGDENELFGAFGFLEILHNVLRISLFDLKGFSSEATLFILAGLGVDIRLHAGGYPLVVGTAEDRLGYG